MSPAMPFRGGAPQIPGAGRGQGLIVVGLDFGTTYSGFAYARRADPDMKLYFYESWPAQSKGGGKPYAKTRTYLLVQRQNDGHFAMQQWGWPALWDHAEALDRIKKARRPQSPAVGPDEASAGYLLQRFKLLLAGSLEGPVSADPLPMGLSVDDAIGMYLHGMGELIMSELRNRYGDHITHQDVDWAITVPAIWDDRAKQTMKRLGEQHLTAGSTPMIVLEPEAAAIYCLKTAAVPLQAGDRYLVVDCGGGTVDLVALEVMARVGEEARLEEVVRGSGGLCGGTYIDDRFMEHMTRAIGCFSEFRERFPLDLLRLQGWWEANKGDLDENSSTTINLPPKLSRAWEDFEIQKGTYDEELEYDTLELTPRDIRMIYAPVIHDILRLIENQLLALGPCKAILLVGGFSGSLYLKNRVKTQFRDRVPNIVCPPNEGAAVCLGAAMYALAPEVISHRVARKTYGISVFKTFEPGDNKQFRVRCESGEYKCKNRFMVFARIGDKIPVGTSQEHFVFPSTSLQTTGTVQIYSTDHPNPRYVTDAKPEGTISLDLSDTTGGLQRKLCVTFKFASTSIEVEARGINFGNGKPVKCPIAFN